MIPFVSENAKGVVTVNIRGCNFFTSSVDVKWSIDSQTYDQEFWANPALSSPTNTPTCTDSPTIDVSPGNHRYYFEYYHPLRSMWVDGGYYDGNFIDGATPTIPVYLDGPNAPPSSPDPPNNPPGVSDIVPPTILSWTESIPNTQANSIADVLYFGTTNPPPHVQIGGNDGFWSSATSTNGWRSSINLASWGIPVNYGTTYYWYIEVYSGYGETDTRPPKIPATVQGPVWSFTTVDTPDTTSPTIISTTPSDSKTGVSTSGGTYIIQFDEPMSAVGTPLSDLPGVSWNWFSDTEMRGTYNALSDFTTYYIDLTGQGFQDLAGNPLAGDMYKEFTTGTGDTTSPTIVSTTPADGATSVSTSAGTYIIQFNEPMSAVGTPLSNLPGVSWSWNGNQKMEGTYNALSESATYYVDLTGQGFQDLVGNPLTGDVYKDFTTGTTTDSISPSAINDLTTSNPTTNSITLSWIAPGDDGASGTATGYIVKYSSSGQITEGNWASATTYSQSWTPLSGGSTESHVVSGLNSGTTYWFAIKAYDEVPNYGGISNSPSGTTTTPPDTTPPTITITSPTSNPTWTTSSTPINLGGTASDNVGVTSVTWSNSVTGGSGTATGTTSWSAIVSLSPSNNPITVTAWDAAGNSGSDTIDVTYNPPVNNPPTASVGSPSSPVNINTGESVTFVVQGYDSDGDLYLVEWYLNGNFWTTSSLSGSSDTGSWQYTFNNAGSYIVEAVVFDSTYTSQNSDTATWSVYVSKDGNNGYILGIAFEELLVYGVYDVLLESYGALGGLAFGIVLDIILDAPLAGYYNVNIYPTKQMSEFGYLLLETNEPFSFITELETGDFLGNLHYKILKYNEESYQWEIIWEWIIEEIDYSEPYYLFTSAPISLSQEGKYKVECTYEGIFISGTTPEDSDSFEILVQPSQTSSLTVEAYSPINILLMDENGRRTGFNSEIQSPIVELPESYYSGPETDPEIIFIKNATGKYTLEIIGTGYGDYHIRIRKVVNGIASEYWINGTISEEAVITENIDMSPPDELPFYNEIWFWGLIYSIVLVVTIIWSVRKRKKDI